MAYRVNGGGSRAPSYGYDPSSDYGPTGYDWEPAAPIQPAVGIPETPISATYPTGGRTMRSEGGGPEITIALGFPGGEDAPYMPAPQMRSYTRRPEYAPEPPALAQFGAGGGVPWYGPSVAPTGYAQHFDPDALRVMQPLSSPAGGWQAAPPTNIPDEVWQVVSEQDAMIAALQAQLAGEPAAGDYGYGYGGGVGYGGGGGGGGWSPEAPAGVPEEGLVEGDLGTGRPVAAPFTEDRANAALYAQDYMAVPDFVRPYLARVLERLGWKPRLWGRYGPYQFLADAPGRIWITADMLAWITDPLIRQWVLAFFGAKGWGEEQSWPPAIE